MTDDRDKTKPDKTKPDERAPREDENRREIPPAGPHDRPDLTNPDATPGTGVLPPGDDTSKRDVDPGGG